MMRKSLNLQNIKWKIIGYAPLFRFKHDYLV
jgi:hypothetical protein